MKEKTTKRRTRRKGEKLEEKQNIRKRKRKKQKKKKEEDRKRIAKIKDNIPLALSTKLKRMIVDCFARIKLRAC